ncbi:isocitrate/isopropylmalate dehydrogenase family protein [Roseomonas nepalensis]|uniref:Isocitrate/isopropylmalate dehydrogenase family protein n=2 Tax=Muricoccus nepalensis TaxID=1854500 RepID=A0A502G7U4_9PROT|nr:isocitrate/isopropylmalate dehydrogenase family protein [Roseomonas nepalensis]
MHLIVLPGDGIGPEITAATVGVLEAVSERFGLGLRLEHDIAGHESLSRHGTTVRPELLERVRAADGLVLGPMSTFEYTDESKGGINPSMFFRKNLDLFANIRPARTYPGVTHHAVSAFDLVVVRENTEGFYADRNMESGGSEMLVTPDVCVSLRRITRPCCERIARAAFRLAMTRRKRVTAVHKANVLKIGDGMFLEECRKVAAEFPEVALDEIIIDAMCAHVVRAPARFDVVVTTNMFGDILSDLTAELSGSIGLGGSVNAGARHAMAQAAHGSAPDIAGQDRANPLSLILSAAQLLDWHADRLGSRAFGEASRAIEAAVADAVAAGESTADVGGRLGTAATGERIAARLRALPALA